MQIKKSIFIIAIFIVSPFGFISCDKSSQNQESAERSMVEVRREMGISRSEVVAEIQTFRIEMASKIMDNNRSIADIKRRIKKEEAKVEVINEARIAVLQTENREMKRNIDNYNDLNRHNWNEFKKDFKIDMDGLNHSLRNFFEISVVSK